MRHVVLDGGCTPIRTAVARILRLRACSGRYTPELSRATARHMAFSRRLWVSYHSRGRPAGMRFFGRVVKLGRSGRGVAAVAIGILLGQSVTLSFTASI